MSDFPQSSVMRIAHPVLFLPVRKDPFDGLLSGSVDHLDVGRVSEMIRFIQIVSPDVASDDLLSLLALSALLKSWAGTADFLF